MRTPMGLVIAALFGSGLVLVAAAPVPPLALHAEAAAPAKVVRLSVKPRKVRVARTSGATFRVVARLSDGTRKNVTSQVRWRTSRARQPHPNAAGYTVAKRAGRTALVARYAGQRSKPAMLRVAKRRPSSLLVTPATSRLQRGQARSLTVTAQFGKWDQDVTPWAQVLSSAPTVVSVDQHVIRAKGPGRALVTAQFRNRSSTPVAIDVPTFMADYESGTVDSGVPGLAGSQQVTAADAATMVASTGRDGGWAIAHKVTLDDPTYVSGNAPRSESSTEYVPETLYRAGDKRRYFFSLSLQDWKDWESGATPIDIIWQFKRLFGLPDVFIGVKRNALIVRYGGSEHASLVPDLRPYDGQWIDLRLSVTWATDSSGSLLVDVRTPGTAGYTRIFTDLSLATMLPDSAGVDHGYLKWGVYRPDSTTANGAPPTRVALHDDIIVELG